MIQSTAEPSGKPASSSPAGLDEFANRFIHSKVRKLVGRAGLTKSDREDLFQDFALDLIQRRQKFDPNSGNWEAFVVVVCENCYATILKRRLAQMRSHKREVGSLNQAIDGKPTELGALISESQQARRTGRYCSPHKETLDLALDMAEVLREMTPRMLKVCELLMRGSKAEAKRELGIPQGVLYEILDRVSLRLEKAGLRDYFK
jgi:RNA polymerase sigma-70 factor, ECF subfamily